MKGINIEENIENRIIDLITKGSEDRLIVFKPKEDTQSIDLVVKKRGEYKSSPIKKVKTPFKIGQDFFAPRKTKSKELSFQVNVFIGPVESDIVVKNILQDNFVPNKNFYLMFVYFDEVQQDVVNIWMMPSYDFSLIAEKSEIENNKATLKFEATINLKNKDKYSRFLVKKEELGNFLLQIVEAKSRPK